MGQGRYGVLRTSLSIRVGVPMSHEGEGDYPAVYKSETRKARKQHVCHACGDTIMPGHQYVYIFSVYDGDTDETRRCARCEAIHSHLREKCNAERAQRRMAGKEQRWPADALNCGEDYAENWGHDPPPEIAALAFALPGEMQVKS